MNYAVIVRISQSNLIVIDFRFDCDLLPFRKSDLIPSLNSPINMSFLY